MIPCHVPMASFLDLKSKLLPSTVPCQLGAAEKANRNYECQRRIALAVGPLRTSMLALLALLLACTAAWGQNGVFGGQNVGVASAAVNVTVTATANGPVATVMVLTMGQGGLDFAGNAGASSCPTATMALLLTPSTCTESVTFTPQSPGRRMGAVVLLDVNKVVLGVTYLSGTGQGGLGVLAPGTLITAAGVFQATSSTQEGGLANAANLNQPASVVMDGIGNLYIADSGNNLIRKVAPPAAHATAGIITAYAGTGAAGYLDNVPATQATLNDPTSVALDGAGNLYIADTENNVVREVLAATGIITTVAGNGTAGFSGDGGAATSAHLNGPMGVTIESDGSLYIADTLNQRIRKVDAVTHIITTVAGNGNLSGLADGKGTYSGDGNVAPATLAGLSLPYAVAFDAAHNMYIPDSANHCVREVFATTQFINRIAGVCTQAGSLGTPPLAINQELNTPSGVAVDAAGNVYISDTGNHRIEKVNAGTGDTTTLVANGSGSILSYNGTTPVLATNAIDAPIGLFVDGNVNVYFADLFNMEIEEIDSDHVVLDFTATPVISGKQTAPLIQTIENDGNLPLNLTGFVPLADPVTNLVNAAVDAGTTTCSTITPLAGDASCQVGVVFAPVVALPFLTGAASEKVVADVDVDGTVNTPALPLITGNFPLDITVVGVALSLNATTTSLSSSLNPSLYGVAPAVTFTATIISGAATPTGTVRFTALTPAGATVILCANAVVNATGAAICTAATTALPIGINTVHAAFTPTASSAFLASSAPTLQQEVDEATATAVTLTAGTNPSTLGVALTFTANVTALGGGPILPDGTVTFYDGPVATGVVIGTPQSLVNGTAAVSIGTLAFGQHTINALYSGDAAKFILSSLGTLVQDVQAPTTTTLTSSLNPSTNGAAVTFTATVATGAVPVPATNGTVNFFDGAVQIGTAALLASGTATLTIANLQVGTHPIRAVYVSNLNYGGSTSPILQQVVLNASSSTALTAVPSPAVAGATVLLTATVTAANPLPQGVLAPTGTVTFVDTLNGVSTTLGVIGLNGNIASIRSPSPPGQHTLVANYSGDQSYNASSATLLLVVNQATTTTTLSTSLNPSPVGAPVTFTAKVAGNGGIASGTVSFTDAFGGSTVTLGTAPLDATGTATFPFTFAAAGTHTITANYSGDANDAPSLSNTISQLVGLIPTATDLQFSTTGGTNPQIVLVAVVLDVPATGNPSTLATPTGTVAFSIVNGTTTTPLGTATVDANGVATLLPGITLSGFNVVAVYSGDATHSPSTSSVLSVSNTTSDFTLSVVPNPVSIVTTKNATVNVVLVSGNGFTDAIDLGCGSLPNGVNCHFSQLDPTLQPNGVLKVLLTIDTNNPLGGGASAMVRSRGLPGISLAGVLLPFSVFFGVLLWRMRVRYKGLLATIMILALGGVAMLVPGCSGFSQASVAPGTYVIQVFAVGAKTGAEQYQNVILTITAK